MVFIISVLSDILTCLKLWSYLIAKFCFMLPQIVFCCEKPMVKLLTHIRSADGTKNNTNTLRAKLICRQNANIIVNFGCGVFSKRKYE